MVFGASLFSPNVSDRGTFQFQGKIHKLELGLVIRETYGNMFCLQTISFVNYYHYSVIIYYINYIDKT